MLKDYVRKGVSWDSTIEDQGNNDGLTLPTELGVCRCIIKSRRGKSLSLNIPICPKCFNHIQFTPTGYEMYKTKIRALILDYGGVISEPQASKNVNNILEILNLEFQDFHEMYLKQRENYDNGQISGEEYWISILQHFNLNQNGSEINRLIQEDVKSWTKINDHMIQFIKKSRCKIHKLAILSNMTKDSLAYIRTHFQWLELFDVSIYSCELGINKPDKNIYEACLHKLAVLPNECLFVDDSVENVNGAIQIGMRAIHYKSFPVFLQDLDEKFYLTQ